MDLAAILDMDLGLLVELFRRWERTTDDVIDFKKIYVDMAGDLIAGLMLSQIVYYHLPNRKGAPNKLVVHKQGHLWIAKSYKQWQDELRITEKQARRALGILAERGLVITARFRFNGVPIMHIRINWGNFIKAWIEHLPQDEQIISAGLIEVPSRADRSALEGESITKTTTKNTLSFANANDKGAERFGSLTEGQKYFLEAFERKRFATKIQAEAIAECEREVGFEVLKQAIDWGARNNIRLVDSILTTARKIARREPRSKQSKTAGQQRKRGPHGGPIICGIEYYPAELDLDDPDIRAWWEKQRRNRSP